MSVRTYSFAESTEELNKMAGRNVYILVYDGQMVASTRLADINTFLKDEDVILQYGDDAESYAIYYGVLLNPEALPVEIPVLASCDLFLFKYDNYTTINVEDTFVDIEDVLSDIEAELADDEAVGIESFSILYGQKIDFMLQAKSPGFTMNAGGIA